MQAAVLVVAAGRGTRIGGEIPKQYRSLQGRPLLAHTLARLTRHPRLQAVRVVIHPADRALYAAAAAGFDLLAPVAGGETRQESVRNGLESLLDLAPDAVLIHDAARPFVEATLIDRLLDALAETEAVIPGLPVADTLKRVEAGRIGATVPRDGLWQAQTPQAFAYQTILEAHRQAAGGNFTDDAAIAEAVGLTVGMVEGSAENFKVTTEPDLARAERQLSAGLETRVGFGTDVHRFGPGDRVVLCGLPIAHDQALQGHSDADVGLHAATDALLGALGAGDIGTHFPPSDRRWRNADSAHFLAHAASLVAARGGRIVHLDITLICERPKIGPHRPAMVARVADILGLTPQRISIKATTTEGLGFTGRREGIAAQAVATVALPPEAAAAESA